MTLARFKDICIDASDLDLMRDFWATALDAKVTPHRTHPEFWWLAPGVRDATAVWINEVPEGPSPAKARVHLDLRIPVARRTPGYLLDAGATVLLEPRPDENWWLLADPEGNEFCAFPPKESQPEGALYELVVDAVDAAAQARWWRRVLGGDLEEIGDDAALTKAAPFEYLVFQNVPEPKTVKNRVHWDVDLTAPTPDALVAAGATVQRAPDDDISWWIMQDPEGNEFCAFAPDQD